MGAIALARRAVHPAGWPGVWRPQRLAGQGQALPSSRRTSDGGNAISLNEDKNNPVSYTADQRGRSAADLVVTRRSALERHIIGRWGAHGYECLRRARAWPQASWAARNSLGRGRGRLPPLHLAGVVAAVRQRGPCAIPLPEPGPPFLSPRSFRARVHGGLGPSLAFRPAPGPATPRSAPGSGGSGRPTSPRPFALDGFPRLCGGCIQSSGRGGEWGRHWRLVKLRSLIVWCSQPVGQSDPGDPPRIMSPPLGASTQGRISPDGVAAPTARTPRVPPVRPGEVPASSR